MYGNVAASARLYGSTVSLTDENYVRITGPNGTNGRWEFLTGLEFSNDTTKKTGPGRAVGAIPTVGLNLLTPNIRGDIYLTVTTTGGAYVLHDGHPSVGTVTACRKLAATASITVNGGGSGTTGGSLVGTGGAAVDEESWLGYPKSEWIGAFVLFVVLSFIFILLAE